MKSIIYIFIVSFVLITTSGCVSTSVQGYTDPRYNTFTARKILVGGSGMNLAAEDLVEVSFKEKLNPIDVQVTGFRSIFPPTRNYTPEEFKKMLKASGFDSLLVVALVDDQTSTEIAGYRSSTTGNVYGTYQSHGYGSGTYSGTGTASTTTHANKRYKRKTQTRATLYDIETGNIVWVGDTFTQAGGSLYMGDSTTVNSTVEEIINELVARGHLIEKPKPKK